MTISAMVIRGKCLLAMLSFKGINRSLPIILAILYHEAQLQWYNRRMRVWPQAKKSHAPKMSRIMAEKWSVIIGHYSIGLLIS
jgi:hypothetical protein